MSDSSLVHLVDGSLYVFRAWHSMPDEFHDHQLVGLRVESLDGEPLGEVTGIEHAPSSDLIVVRRPGGGTALIPFVRQIVPEVDVPGGRVVVDPPGGLFDL